MPGASAAGRAEATPGAKVIVGMIVLGQDGQPQLIAERRFVRVADRRDGNVGITEGIKEGDRVITSGQIRLQPNAAVTIDDRPSLVPPKERPKP